MHVRCHYEYCYITDTDAGIVHSSNMSKSLSVRRSLARSYAKVCGSRPSEDIGSRRASEPTYIPQVEQKVDALNINFDSPAETPPATVTSGNTGPMPITVPSEGTGSGSVAPRDTNSEPPDTSLSVATQSSVGTVGEITNSNNTPGAEQLSTSTETLTASNISVEENKKKFAKNVTDPDFIRDYFSNLVEHPAANAVDENIDEAEHSLSTSVEIGKAQERGEHRFAQVCNFPLKLILTPISRGGVLTATFSSLLEMEFGPLHAALQVGDVILEWNDTSLVVPHFCEHDDPLLKANIQHLTGWVDFTHDHFPRMREAAEQLDYQGQIELIFRATAEKSRLIDELVKVIVKYNRHCYYNLIDRNCQHFVLDALKALGVEKPIQFTGGLGEYFKALKLGRSKSVPVQYKNHAELDVYVKCCQANNKLDSMPQGDLEFLLAQYFQFHLQDRDQYKKDPVAMENWKCTERECHMQELEKRIELKNLRIHNFRTVH